MCYYQYDLCTATSIIQFCSNCRCQKGIVEVKGKREGCGEAAMPDGGWYTGEVCCMQYRIELVQYETVKSMRLCTKVLENIILCRKIRDLTVSI